MYIFSHDARIVSQKELNKTAVKNELSCYNELRNNKIF